MPKTHSWKVAVSVLVLTAACVSCSEPAAERVDSSSVFTRGSWIDLSYTFSNETIYWPTAESFELDTVSYGETPGGFFYAANNFKAAEHGGTHLDAPIHFSAGKQTVDQIPVENLTGPVIRVDVSDSALSDRDYLVSVDDLLSWESSNGSIPNNAMVLVYTGFGRFWPNAEAYMGTSARGVEALSDLRFPGLDPEAARWLTVSRVIKGVGIDTPSIDRGQSTTFETHQILAAANILIFENVANLDQLPVTGAWLIAAPMKIKGGSGGPARMLAFVPSP